MNDKEKLKELEETEKQIRIYAKAIYLTIFGLWVLSLIMDIVGNLTGENLGSLIRMPILILIIFTIFYIFFRISFPLIMKEERKPYRIKEGEELPIKVNDKDDFEKKLKRDGFLTEDISKERGLPGFNINHPDYKSHFYVLADTLLDTVITGDYYLFINTNLKIKYGYLINKIKNILEESNSKELKGGINMEAESELENPEESEEPEEEEEDSEEFEEETSDKD